MLRNIKNEILNKPSFSKKFSIIESTIHALKVGSKNLGGKSLIKSNISLKTILFGLLLSLVTLQCAKTTVTDVTPDVTPGPTPVQNDLVLSVNSLTMYASNGYTASFTITTDQNWTITGYPNWLSVSPTSGAPGTALKVTLTTTTLNTVTGITGSLSVNATGKPELNKTLNLTRSIYDFCGGTLGLPGPSIVVAKWVSMGAAEHGVFDTRDPNGRVLVAIAKGCGGVGWTTIEEVIAKSDYVKLGFYAVAGEPIINSNTLFFANNPIGGLSATPTSAILPSYIKLYFRNYLTSVIEDFEFLYSQNPYVGIERCNLSNQYILRNLKQVIATSNGQNCITDSQFPPELKDTMNALLEGAGKTYRIP